jgi:hypothetical protein
MVQEKLRGAFEKEFADETVVPERNWHQAETEALESFIEDHARGFVARTDVLESIDAVLASPAGQTPICISGAAGEWAWC